MAKVSKNIKTEESKVTGAVANSESLEYRLINLDAGYYPLIALFLGAFAMYILMSICQFVTGKYSILEGDLIEIYIPAIKSFYRNLLNGENPFYSWNNWLGMNTSAYMAFSAFSIFNVFYLLPFDSGVITIFLTIFRTGLAAAAFEYSARKIFKSTGIQTIVFAVFYSMCSFQISYNVTNIIWQDALILLPLIIYLIIDFVQNGTWLKLCLVYFYLFVSNFYMGYVIGFFSFLVFLICLFNSDTQYKLKRLSFYVFLVVLAACLGAVILVPAAIYLFTEGAEDVSTLDGIYINIMDVLNQLFIGENNGISGIFPYIYCGIPCILASPLYFAKKEISIKEKIISAGILVLLLISAIIKPLYMFWHVFDAPDSWGYRFAFLISYVLCMISCRALMDVNKENIKRCIAVLGGSSVVYVIIYIACMLYQRKRYIVFGANTMFLLILNVSIILLWSILYVAYSYICCGKEFIKRGKEKGAKSEQEDEKEAEKVHETKNEKESEKSSVNNKIAFAIIFIMFSVVETVLNGYFEIYGRVDTTPSILADNYGKWNDSVCQAVADINELQANSNEFYRVSYINDYIHNSDSFFGYNGISDFSTMENYNLRKFLENIGTYTSTRMLCPYGADDLTKMLLAVKYDVKGIIPYYEVNENNKTTIDETAYYKGIFIPVSEAIEKVSFDSRDVFENSNKLASSIAGEEIQLYSKAESVSYNEVGINKEQMEDSVLLRADDSDLGMKFIQYSILADERPAYSAFDCSESLFINSCPYFYGGEENNIYTNGLFGVLYKKPMIKYDKAYTVSICMDASTYQSVLYNDEYFYYYNADEMERLSSIIDENGAIVNIKQISNGKIKAEANISKDSTLLLISVPYNKNWKIKINGVEKNIVPLADNAFCGIKLDIGNYEIQMNYVVPGLTFGIVFTCISFAILCLATFISKKNNAALS